MNKKIMLVMIISTLMIGTLYFYYNYAMLKNAADDHLQNNISRYNDAIRLLSEELGGVLEKDSMDISTHFNVIDQVIENSRIALSFTYYYDFSSHEDNMALEKLFKGFEDTTILAVKDDYPYVFTDEEREPILVLQGKLSQQIAYLDSIADLENVAWEQFVKGLFEVMDTYGEMSL